MEWEIHLNVDAVLRNQGGDPVQLRDLNPRLVSIAEQAISEGSNLIHPSVHQQRRKVRDFKHQKLQLDDGVSISGPLISRHMSAADEIVATLLTIGHELETHAAKVMKRFASLGIALDAVGSTAIEALSHTICYTVEKQAHKANQQTTIPLNPGMLGWPVDQGQAQLFALWGDEPLDIQLTDSFMMVPSKSLSMLIGVGSQVRQDGTPCDYCSEHMTCRYRKQNDG
jgi:cobalamin-dependent methionine synthase I